MRQKNIILAIVLSALVLIGWQLYFFTPQQRWSCFLRQAVKVDSAMKRVIHHEDAETVFG